jgi:hypothetical protein
MAAAPSNQTSRSSTVDHSNDFEIRWKNFRSYLDTKWRRIKPLTIIIGPNNCGKSNFFAPLLLFNQTWLSREDSTTPLVTKGRFIDGGMFRDVLYAKSLNRNLTLGLRFHLHDPKKEKKLGPVGTYPPGRLELTFQPVKEGVGAVLKEARVSDLYGRAYFARRRLRAGYGLSGEISLEKMKPLEAKAVRRCGPVNFFFSPTKLLYEYQDLCDEGKSPRKDYSSEFTHLLNAIGASMSGAQSFLNRLTYIGPLREKPRRYYEVGAEEHQSVGVSGENTADLLRSASQQKRNEIDRWSETLGFGSKVSIRPHTDDIVSIEFADKSGTSVNICDLGFGVSQVFPLVVQAVAANPGTITIAEQPEIHLNPRLQSVLADIFASMIQRDQHVLVETHSEHLLLRVRTLVARGDIDASQVAIFYIDRPGEASRIRELPLEDNGHISTEHWPDGFFDDTLRESLSLAKAQSSGRRKSVRPRGAKSVRRKK